MQSFNQNVIKHKTGLLNLAAELGNISQACRIMGFSRDTFYRYQTARDSGGIEALFDANRRKPNLKKGRQKRGQTASQDLERKGQRDAWQEKALTRLPCKGLIFLAERKGLEPSASGVTGRRYNRLNYRSACGGQYRT